MQLFMGHIVPCLHFIERKNIFSSCVSSTQFFLNSVCVFLFIPNTFIFPQNCFSQNLFCFSYFIGGEIFFIQGELSLFSFILLRMFSVYLLIRQSLSIRDKKGETQMTCLFCLGGEYKKLFVVSNLGGELVFFLYSVSYYCLYVFFSTHAVMCLLSVSGKTSAF